jgi:hypothetical protein
MKIAALLLVSLGLVSCSADSPTGPAGTGPEVPTPPENVAPVSVFSVACAELTCAFTNASSDGDGEIASAVFHFGDGTSSSEPNPTHVYETGGTYSLRLVITDDDGAVSESAQEIWINATPQVQILAPATNTRVDFGTEVTLVAGGEDVEPGPLNYTWYLLESGARTPIGSGQAFTTSELPKGEQVLTVEVTDAGGATAEASVTLEVYAPILVLEISGAECNGVACFRTVRLDLWPDTPFAINAIADPFDVTTGAPNTIRHSEITSAIRHFALGGNDVDVIWVHWENTADGDMNSQIVPWWWATDGGTGRSLTVCAKDYDYFGEPVTSENGYCETITN